MSKPKIVAALLMGGSGQRFNSPLPKQFVLLGGKPVYLHALNTLEDSKLFDEILIVCHKDFINRVDAETQGRARVVEGGSTRQASSYEAIKAADPSIDYILFHDAVRPFVSVSLLEAHIKNVIEYKAVNTCIPATDTLVQSLDGKTIDTIPTRSEYYRGQTPQTFSLPLIRRAHEKALEETFIGTDDCGLVHRLPHPVHLVHGSEQNIKITTETDLYLAEQILRLQTKRISTTSTHSLSGKTYIVCGGNGCIGSAIVKALNAQSAHTIVVSRTSSPYSVDLSDADATKLLFDKISRDIGPVDGLINCVGELIMKPFKDLSIDEMQSLLGCNLTAVLHSCKFADLKPKAHIVNVSSSSYSRGRKNYILYSATKAAVVNFTQGLSQENPEYFINAIAPQRTLSEMRKKHFPKESPTDLLRPDAIAEEVILLLKGEDTGLVIDIKKI